MQSESEVKGLHFAHREWLILNTHNPPEIKTRRIGSLASVGIFLVHVFQLADNIVSSIDDFRKFHA